MKILVVGGAGYVGGYLTDILYNEKIDVTVLDNLTYERSYLKKVNFIYGDIRNFELINSLINNFDLVIWLAALVGDGACAINPKLTHEINTNSVENLCNNFKGKIIFISTCSIYGFNNKIIDEDGEKQPLSIYASSKLKAEKYIVNRNDNFQIIRLGTVFGLGDLFSRIRLDLVVNILTLKASNNEPMTVYGGNQFRPLVHVKDVSEFICHSINKKEKGIFNLSYKNYKIVDIAKKIKSNFKDCEIIFSKEMFQDSRNYKVSSIKANNTGFKFKYNLDYGIKELKSIFTEKRIKNTDDNVYNNQKFLSSKLN